MINYILINYSDAIDHHATVSTNCMYMFQIHENYMLNKPTAKWNKQFDLFKFKISLLTFLFKKTIRFFIKVTVFMLFLYPMVHQRWSFSPIIGITSSRLQRVVTMATTSMATCSLSDMIALSLVHLVFPKNSPRSINSAVYDFSLVVNTVSIILCFEDSPLFSSYKKAGKDVELANKLLSEAKRVNCDSGETLLREV